MHELFAFTLRKWAAFGVPRSRIFLEREKEEGMNEKRTIVEREGNAVELLPAHNSLSLDAAALFCCCCLLWMTKSVLLIFFFGLGWFGEWAKDCWRVGNSIKYNVKMAGKNMHRKITANKFTTLTALHSPRPPLSLYPHLSLSLEWGYWHCSSRAATWAAQLLRLYRC